MFECEPIWAQERDVQPQRVHLVMMSLGFPGGGAVGLRCGEVESLFQSDVTER